MSNASSTSGSVLRIALPALAENVLATLVGLTDLFLAGRISADATAAVALVSMLGWLVGTLFSMVGVGALALVSRSAGAGDWSAVRLASGQAIRLAGLWGGVVGVGLGAATPAIPLALRLEAGSFDLARQLIAVQAVGFVFLAVLSVTASCLKATGDARTPLWVMLWVNAVNIAASVFLCFGFGGLGLDLRPLGLVWAGLGAHGIAAGTLLAWTVGAVMMVRASYRGARCGAKGVGAELGRRALEPGLGGPLHRATCVRILRVGVPACVDSLLSWIAQLCFMGMITRIAGHDGTVLYAAHMLAVRIESLSYLPATAFAVAAAALVGQRLGARRPSQARRLGWVAAGLASGIGLVMGLLYFLFPQSLLGLFTSDPGVLHLGTAPLQIVAFAQVHLVVAIVLSGALRGAGYTRPPVVITLICMYAIRLPLAWILIFEAELGLVGAWMAMLADLLVRGLLVAERFLRGRWYAVRV